MYVSRNVRVNTWSRTLAQWLHTCASYTCTHCSQGSLYSSLASLLRHCTVPASEPAGHVGGGGGGGECIKIKYIITMDTYGDTAKLLPIHMWNVHLHKYSQPEMY